MLNPWYLAPLALSIDLLVGDPAFLIHPVRVMGAAIDWLDHALYRDGFPPWLKLALGGLLWLIVVSLSGAAGLAFLYAAYRIHPVLVLPVNLWLCSTSIAARGLCDAGESVRRALSAGDLDRARAAVGCIVGRDTGCMAEADIIRATVESVAENTVDGAISPLIFASLGGAPLALVYRAINTMDSMLGYKDSRYLYFGRVAARMDDAANYIPARAAGLMMVFSAFTMGLNHRAAWRVWMRDHAKHPSPNAGVPESVVAGALGVQLGGLNHYDGIPRHRAEMGDPVRRFAPDDILAVEKIMYRASAACALICGAVLWLTGFGVKLWVR